MTHTHYGASHEEWQKLIDLGLTEDLLPVVSNPGAQISKSSTMKTLGKTPSLYNSNGEVVGLGKWTQKVTTEKEVAAWRKEKDYGVCLQTRNMRALDIDVDDAALSGKITRFVREFLDDEEMLIAQRYRKNSGKCLLAFKVEGEFGKRILKVDGGAIEFLASGQQFIAAGTHHPSYERYQWTPEDFRFYTFTPEEFEALWFALELEFGIAKSSDRNAVRNAPGNDVVTDATAQFLEDNGFALDHGSEGQVFIECPWKDNHSIDSGPTETAYFPAGSRGYDRGHFVCLHAGCADRTDDEFMDAFGVRAGDFDIVEIEEIPEDGEPELPVFARDKYGQPKALLDNVIMALRRPDICGVEICYDAFRDEIIFYGKERNKWERENDERFIKLRHRLEKLHGFKPIGRELMRDAVRVVAKDNTIDTAQEWLNALEWDGVQRIENFMHEYLGTDETDYNKAISLYLWTGLAGRILVPGLKADMAVILKSPEGYRKTSAIEAIAPSPEEFTEISFDDKDDDNARKIRGVLIAEISELRGLHTKDEQSIMAFISRRFEKWVPKFKEFATTFPRRNMFIGTTNEDQFLTQSREHRRWLPTICKADASVEHIARDRALLWAEARERFKQDGLLFADAERLAKEQIDNYKMHDAWFDVISDWLESPDSLDEGTRPLDRPFIRTIDVAREALNIDPRQVKRLDQMKIADVLKAHGYENKLAYVEGRRVRAWFHEFHELA